MSSDHCQFCGGTGEHCRCHLSEPNDLLLKMAEQRIQDLARIAQLEGQITRIRDECDECRDVIDEITGGTP